MCSVCKLEQIDTLSCMWHKFTAVAVSVHYV